MSKLNFEMYFDEVIQKHEMIMKKHFNDFEKEEKKYKTNKEHKKRNAYELLSLEGIVINILPFFSLLSFSFLFLFQFWFIFPNVIGKERISLFILVFVHILLLIFVFDFKENIEKKIKTYKDSFENYFSTMKLVKFVFFVTIWALFLIYLKTYFLYHNSF